MNINQIIDEMQASLTKLRGHFRKMGTAGECNCWSVPSGLDCPVHGEMLKDCANWMSTIRHDIERRALGGKPTPDLPLRVRVAKALEYDPYEDGGSWVMQEKASKISDPLERPTYHVPDYPNDLVAAMGALEEYCSIGPCYAYRIAGWGKMETKEVFIEEDHDSTISAKSYTLPQAICEAIVAHAEGK